MKLAPDRGLRHFTEACDASAALSLPGGEVVVANDEDSILRVYDPAGGPPIARSVDLGAHLHVESGEELDLEAAAWVGDLACFVTSHGTNKKGRLRPARRRLFAMRLELDGDRLRTELVAPFYGNLAEDLVALDRDGSMGLEPSLSRPPKEGGFNIEGLAASADGDLWIGLRSPLVHGDALLFRIEPPDGGSSMEALAVSGPVRLDLGGSGVRGLARMEDDRSYLVVSGPAGKEAGGFALHRWSPEQPEGLRPVSTEPELPEDLRPESVIIAKGVLTVFSDDGAFEVDGRECKKLEASERAFRAIDLRLVP